MNRYGFANWHQRQRSESDYRERAVIYQWSRSDFWAHVVTTHGTSSMWSAHMDESYRGEIRAAIARELGVEPLTDTMPDEPVGGEVDVSETPSRPLCAECLSPLLMPFEHTRAGCSGGWECDACHKPTLEIVGCLSCANVVCQSCYDALPEEGQPVTLRALSERFARTVERVRQIELNAIRKLQCPDRWRLSREEFRAFGSDLNGRRAVYGGAQ